MQDQFPRGIKTGFCGLRLPEFQVEWPVHIFQLASAFDKIGSHICLYNTILPCEHSFHDLFKFQVFFWVKTFNGGYMQDEAAIGVTPNCRRRWQMALAPASITSSVQFSLSSGQMARFAVNFTPCFPGSARLFQVVGNPIIGMGLYCLQNNPWNKIIFYRKNMSQAWNDRVLKWRDIKFFLKENAMQMSIH